jgi:hypothetical protein
VLEWSRELPPESVAKPPVCIAVADARVEAMDWEKLKESVESGDWGSFEFARLAYKARALERLNARTGSEAAWAEALSATKGSPQRLEALAKTALTWRWESRGEDALWKLAAMGSTPSWALEALWNAALRRGDTAHLREVSKLRMSADPGNVAARNNFIFLSLLTHSKKEGLHQLAEALWKEMPTQPDVVATFAFSLHQQGKYKEALAAMRTLKPEELRQPGVARYYGIFLAEARKGAEAGEYLALGDKDVVLPEEKTLLAHAQEAVRFAASNKNSNAPTEKF